MKRIILFCILIFALLFTVACGGSNNANSTYIATVDGRQIPIAYFNYALSDLMQDPQAYESIRQQGLDPDEAIFNLLVQIFVTTARADELGIYLTPEDIAEINDLASEWFYSDPKASESGFTEATFIEYGLMLSLRDAIYAQKAPNISEFVRFNELVELWVEEAVVIRNTRVLPYPQ